MKTPLGLKCVRMLPVIMILFFHGADTTFAQSRVKVPGAVTGSLTPPSNKAPTVGNADPAWISSSPLLPLGANNSGLTLKYGPRMEISQEASIEFWIKIPSKSSDGKAINYDQPVCIVSSARLSGPGQSQVESLWGVYFSKDGFYISADGKRVNTSSNATPLTFDTWQHVVINSTYWPANPAKEQSDAFQKAITPITSSIMDWGRGVDTDKIYAKAKVDGAVNNQDFLLPSPTATGTIQLTLGSGPGAIDFTGKLGVIRIWDRQLDSQQIQWLADFKSFDTPSDDCPTKANLLCNINKTTYTSQQSLVVPEIYVMPFDEDFNQIGVQSFSRRPTGMSPKSIWIVRKALDDPNRFETFEKLAVEYAETGTWKRVGLPWRSQIEKILNQFIAGGLVDSTNLRQRQTQFADQLATADLLPIFKAPSVPVIVPQTDPIAAQLLTFSRLFEIQLADNLRPSLIQFAKDNSIPTDQSALSNPSQTASTKATLELAAKAMTVMADESLSDIVEFGDFKLFFLGKPMEVTGTDFLSNQLSPELGYKSHAVFGGTFFESADLCELLNTTSQQCITNATADMLRAHNFTPPQWSAVTLRYVSVGNRDALERIYKTVGQVSCPWTGDEVRAVPSFLPTFDSKPATDVVGIAGTHDGNIITSLRIIFGNGEVSSLFAVDGQTEENDTFLQRLPTVFPDDYPIKELAGKAAVAQFEGFVTQGDDRGLHAITMAYSFKPRLSYQADNSLTDQGLTVADLTKSRYVALGHDWQTPEIVTSSTYPGGLPASLKADPSTPNDAPIHGNFTSSPVYRFTYNDTVAELTLHCDRFLGNSAVGVTEIVFKPENVSKPGSKNWISDQGDILTPSIETVSDITKKNRQVMIASVQLKGQKFPFKLTPPLKPLSVPVADGSDKAALYNTPPYDKMEGWNTAQFSQNQRPPFLSTNYASYNIAKMVPGNYQSTGGTSEPAFLELEDGDKAYYAPTNGLQLFIPNTIQFVPGNMSATMDAVSISNSSNEDQSSWGLDLGISGGSKVGGSFSLHAAYNQELATTIGQGKNIIRARAVTQLYSFVIDRSLVDLPTSENGLRTRLKQIEAALLAGIPIPTDYENIGSNTEESEAGSWREFFEYYGTHYPYAVVYGGTVTSLDTITTSQFDSFQKSTVELKTSAKAKVMGLYKLGLSGGFNLEKAQNYENNTEQSNSSHESYGGQIDSNGGWSCGHGQEVPIFLDLRPIYELLSPIYFDDPLVWKLVRNEMMARHAEYLTVCASKSTWIPPIVSWDPDAEAAKAAADAKAASDAQAASIIHFGSKFTLQNKSTQRYISSETQQYRMSEGSYSRLTSDAKMAEVFTLKSSDMSNPLDTSPVKYMLAGNLISLPTNDDYSPFLTSLRESIGFAPRWPNTSSQTWTFLKADQGTSTDPLRDGDIIRIRNDGDQGYLFDYNGQYVWSDSSKDDDGMIWIIKKIPD